MSKESIIEQVRGRYFPDWKPSPKVGKAVQDIETLYDLPTDSRDYFELKARVITYIAINCIDQLSSGTKSRGILTRGLLDDLLLDLSRRENENN